MPSIECSRRWPDTRRCPWRPRGPPSGRTHRDVRHRCRCSGDRGARALPDHSAHRSRGQHVVCGDYDRAVEHIGTSCVIERRRKAGMSESTLSIAKSRARPSWRYTIAWETGDFVVLCAFHPTMRRMLRVKSWQRPSPLAGRVFRHAGRRAPRAALARPSVATAVSGSR